MKYKFLALLVVATGLLWAGTALMKASEADETAKMTKEELKGKLGHSDLVIVDVRAGGSWEDSDSKIKGAVREDPKAVHDWIQKYPKDKTFVFYCS